MADLAREEANRYLNSREHRPTSHPEDRDDSDQGESDTDDQATFEPAFPSSSSSSSHRRPNISADDSNGEDDDDDDLSYKMATMTTSRTSYQVPTTISYANTGPKGVIADAQHFARAKKSTFRQTLSNLANNFSHPKASSTIPYPERTRHVRGNSQSDRENSSDEDCPNSDGKFNGGQYDEEEDEDFMTQWRQSRLHELQSQSQSQQQQQRRMSPSRRVYGSVPHVTATGYLDALEHSPPSTTVVVLLFDPTKSNPRSRQAELICEYMASKHLGVRFIKLDFSIAEMEYLDCPSVVVYRAGEVVGMVTGMKGDFASVDENGETGLERDLISQGVLA